MIPGFCVTRQVVKGYFYLKNEISSFKVCCNKCGVKVSSGPIQFV